MQLSHILKGITDYEMIGDFDPEIVGLTYDSRQVKQGVLFVALKGYSQNGHAFIKEALQQGAVAVVGETFNKENGVNNKVTMIRVPDSRRTLSELAVNFYGHPFNGMNLIGITGTNGKTTTSYLLESILLAASKNPGVIGTIDYRSQEQTWKAPTTTPESLELMQILRKMADTNVSDVIMEVSSHALDQGRILGCPFQVGVFTNISRDHLDYHHSMEKYFQAKSILFKGLGQKRTNEKARAVINWDDPKGKDVATLTDVPVLTYGLGKNCDVRANQIRSNRTGLEFKLIIPERKIDIKSSLIGDFNVYNILAASAAALSINIEPEEIRAGIARLKGVPGRLELVKNKRSLTIVVDYAHTPDALIKAMSAIRSLVKEGRLITVFGCGGDRDKGKRKEMGYAAGKHSDLVIITSDNPRSEDPEDIISQIEDGTLESGLKRLDAIPADQPSGYTIDQDRGSAIRKAINIAKKNDIILIAGKGHEDYQIIGKDKRHFDDREIAAEAAS